MKSAIRITVGVIAAVMGLAGVEHGVGEILQGNVPTSGLMIRSWPGSAFFQSLNGEPALTVLPTLLPTGLLAVLFSSAFVAWSILGSHRKYGGVGLMLLALPMFLFGGGIFPPVLGFLVGAFAQLAASSHRPAAAAGANRWIGRAWPWVFAACCAAWLALFPGVAILGYSFGIDQIGVTLSIMAAAFVLLPLAFWSSLQHDRSS
jgi:hypothetical protein